MKHTIIAAAAAAAATAALSGCTITADPTPTRTVTAPTQSPDPAPSLTDMEIDQITLEIVWDDMTASDRQTICEVYRVSPEFVWQQFNEGSEGAIDKSSVLDFFDGVC